MRLILHGRLGATYRLSMIPTPAIETDLLQGLMGVGLLVMASTGCVILLRSSRFPMSGRAVVAGLLAGLMIGPTIFGRVMPERFESIYHGGVKQREALEYVRFLSAAASQSLRQQGDETMRAVQEQSSRELMEKQQAWDEARWRHQSPLRVSSMLLAAIALFFGAVCPTSQGDARQRWITSASIGIWSFALPAAAGYVCAMRWWGTSIEEAAMLAAAVGIGPWMLSAIEREAADGAELGGARVMQTAGRIASSMALMVAGWAAWSAGGVGSVVFMLPLMAMPVGWIIAQRLQVVAPSHETAEDRTVIQRAGRWVIEPTIATLTAILCLSIDLHTQLSWTILAMIVALALIADDGRWLGALLGALMLGGRQLLRTSRLVMPAMAAGTTQLSIAVLAIQAALLPERFALPLLAGVLLIELTAHTRRRMTRQIAEVERELDEDPSNA